jgi:prepilin-type processing-associated H-X9-DG protein
MPAGCSRLGGKTSSGVVGGSYYWGVPHTLLPFNEQGARYEMSLSNLVAMTPTAAQKTDTERVHKSPISTYLCPSDGNSKLPGTFTDGTTLIETARINIVPCFGDWLQISNPATDIPTAPSSPTAADTSFQNITRMLFGNLCWRSMAIVTDGTSNTIAFSELVTGDVVGTKRIKGGIVANITGLTTDVSLCMNVPKDNTNTFFTGTAVSNWRGHIYSISWISIAGFNAVLPPNGPSCAISASSGASGIYSASSNHSGGVNVGFLDGSVKFVSETISCGTLTGQGQVRSGPSNFGIWGALGTPSGGETASP